MNSTIKLHDHHKYNLIANDYLSLHIILSINALNLGSPINNDVIIHINFHTNISPTQGCIFYIFDINIIEAHCPIMRNGQIPRIESFMFRTSE